MCVDLRNRRGNRCTVDETAVFLNCEADKIRQSAFRHCLRHAKRLGQRRHNPRHQKLHARRSKTLRRPQVKVPCRCPIQHTCAGVGVPDAPHQRAGKHRNAIPVGKLPRKRRQKRRISRRKHCGILPRSSGTRTGQPAGRRCQKQRQTITCSYRRILPPQRGKRLCCCRLPVQRRHRKPFMEYNAVFPLQSLTQRPFCQKQRRRGKDRFQIRIRHPIIPSLCSDSIVS